MKLNKDERTGEKLFDGDPPGQILNNGSLAEPVLVSNRNKQRKRIFAREMIEVTCNSEKL